MKKRIRLLATAVVFAAMSLCVSCNKDDEEPSNTGGDTPAAPTNVINGHKYVDLGLPDGLLWATCNVGAAKPEDCGDYYAWGETEMKNDYSWSNYKFDKDNGLTKYCTDSSCGYDGFKDDITVLQDVDDVARVKWGSPWRMPTQSECQALIDNTYWQWTTNYHGVDGLNGYIVYRAKDETHKGKKNESSITQLYSIDTDIHLFFPAAGAFDGTSVLQEGSAGMFWSSSLDLSETNWACQLGFFGNVLVSKPGSCRYIGFTVRPVR